MHEYYEYILEMMIQIEDTIYSKDEQEHLRSFINSYSQDNFNDIKFNWNGKQAEGLMDSNSAFREKVMFYYIVHPPKSDNKLLLRDLFVEQCKLSNETWGAIEWLGILGEKLLNSGSDLYILDFIKYYSVTMDTYAVCSDITLTIDAKRIATDKINSMIENKEFSKFDEEKLRSDLEWIEGR